MNTPAANATSMTGEQIMGAFVKAMRFSDEMDATGSAEGFDRSWHRLSAFVTSLGMELDNVAPGLYQQVLGYQMRVTAGENSLRDAYRLANGDAQ
jgi:hypothetical protein